MGRFLPDGSAGVDQKPPFELTQWHLAARVHEARPLLSETAAPYKA